MTKNLECSEEQQRADVCTVSAIRQGKNSDEDEVAGARGMSGEARCVRTCVYADSEEAELGPPQSSPRAFDQQCRSDHVHSRNRTQPTGTLHRARARRPCEG